MHIYLLFLFCFAGRVVRTEPYNSSALENDVATSLSGDLLLASEETPTRAPRPVTKQGQKTSKSSEDALLLTDCSEPLNKDISCSVHIVGCSDPIFEYVEAGKEPPGAHDVRIAPTTKVMGSNRIDKRKHRLHVDVSWQIPQLNESRFLRAFKLLVRGPEGRNTCFVFNVTHSQHDESVSPRYRFSSNTLFDFGHNYTVTIISLPVSRKKSPKVSAHSLMPDDPDEAPKVVKTHEEICAAKSNPQASKWAASFRKIFLFSAIKMIQIEFLAAPPQYCFEEYEVRLLDSSGIVMLQSAVVSREDLKTEIINGRPVQFGEYNFTDIELDTDLIPSVIPIETAKDGRCLCETENGCSCLAADWKPVKLTKIEKPPMTSNKTLESDHKTENGSPAAENNLTWHSLAFMGVVFLAVMFGVLLCFGASCYHRFEKSKKSSNIHLLNENPSFTNPGAMPLIVKQSLSVLILYSHDSSQHDAAVLAFAELLRDVFNMNVHLDVWDEEDIEMNKAEYINSSIVRADKVIVINSIGSYFRTSSRQMREPSLERIVPGLHDSMFMTQIDLAMQHPCVVSCYFSYTNPKYIFFPINRLLQYNIPESLLTMVTTLTGQTTRSELAGFNSAFARLQSAISRKNHYIETVPQWFENTHHRIARAPPVIEPLPIPIPISLPIKEETSFDQQETRPISEIELEPIKRTEIIQDDDGIEDEEVADEDSAVGEEEVGRTARVEELERLIVNKDQHDSGNLDSAYVSGSDFSTEIHSEVLDKPRLNSEKDCYTDKRKRNVGDSAFHDDVIGVH